MNRIYLGDVEVANVGSGGGGITPAQLDASLREYAYDKSWIDTSIHQIDTSINALEQGGGGGGGTKLSDFENDMDFRSITYMTVDDYNQLVEDEQVDPSVMYILVDAAEVIETADFVSRDELENYAEKSELDNLVKKNDISIYATVDDMDGYITRAEAGQVVESHYSSYITSFNNLSADYEDVSDKLGDMESILDQMLNQ